MTSTESTAPRVSYITSGPYSWEGLVGDPAVHLVISSNDFATIVAFWSADQSLIDSQVAYPACPEGVDEDECEHWTHQPLKAASGELFSALCAAVLGAGVRDRLFADLGANHDDVVASLLRVGVRIAA